MTRDPTIGHHGLRHCDKSMLLINPRGQVRLLREGLKASEAVLLRIHDYYDLLGGAPSVTEVVSSSSSRGD